MCLFLSFSALKKKVLISCDIYTSFFFPLLEAFSDLLLFFSPLCTVKQYYVFLCLFRCGRRTTSHGRYFFFFPSFDSKQTRHFFAFIFFFTWLIALFVLQIKCWCSECIFSWNRVEFFLLTYILLFFPLCFFFCPCVFFFFPDWGKCYDYFDWRPTLYTCTVSQ